MKSIWISLFLTSACWLYLVPTFTPANLELAKNTPWVWFIFISVALTTLDWWRVSIPFKLKDIFLFLIPTLVCVGVFPFPYNIGFILILSGLCCSIFSILNKKFISFSMGLIIPGFFLVIQLFGLSLFYWIAPRIHEVKVINALAYPIVRLLGLFSSLSEGIIYLPTIQNVMAVPATIEKAGAFPLVLILISSVCVIYLARLSIWQISKIITTITCYTLIRYIVLIFILAQVRNAEIYWLPYWQIITWIPLIILLYLFVPTPTTANDWHRVFPFAKQNLALPVMLFFISTVFFTAGIFFKDPGITKQGRILIDDAHSGWEVSTRKFDTTWFGSPSTYNYYNLFEYLNHFYQAGVNEKQKITPKLLSDYDVLILKTPTKAFDGSEIETIVDYVKNGGGLWLIGDHTNIFGMDYYLNFIAKRFGLFFHYDSTYDLKAGTLTLYDKPLILPHPVVQNMPTFLFATSCTLDAPFISENIIIGYGLRSRLLAYSGRGFFEFRPTQDYEFGLFLQKVGVNYGRGRVVAFSDSTCFSNFYMFVQGKPEMALGTVEWLNRENRFGYLRIVFLGSAFFLLGIGINRSKKKSLDFLGIWLLATFLAVPVTIFSLSILNKKVYGLPEAHTPISHIVFEMEHGDYTLPIEAYVEKHPKNYHTFYVWTQRVGYVPSASKSLIKSLENNPQFIVMINPVKNFTANEIEGIKHFLNKGGKLLVMDDPKNKKTTVNQLLAPFQMGINQIDTTSEKIYDGDHTYKITANKSGIINGGTPQFFSKTQNVIFATKKIGKGKLGVMANSKIFGNPVMGGTQIKPSNIQQKIYDLEFSILQQMRDK